MNEERCRSIVSVDIGQVGRARTPARTSRRDTSRPSRTVVPAPPSWRPRPLPDP
ncbi:hypothetical protein QJS66_19650 [Kocuria rhizophila]|nr:hypothetical protein QJS66_19650 [Kocuria rhizophila]